MLKNDIPMLVETFCPHPFHKIKVDSEGNVTMCCFHERKCLGNLLHSNIAEIWNCHLAKEIREYTARGKLHHTCTAHQTCPFVYEPLVKSQIGYMPFPTTLEIDLPTQWCNIGGLNPDPVKNPACLMCERHTRFQYQVDRLKEVCSVLREHISNFCTIHFQGVAECFWKDRVFEIMDDLNVWNHKDKVEVTTTTSGTIFTKERMERWLEYPSSILTFSIDASNPGTYKKIRRLDVYDRVIENLMLYSSLRKPGQALKIHNSINTVNVEEVVDMVKVAHEAKVDVIEFNPTYETPGICVDKSNVELFRQAEKRIVQTAQNFNVNVFFMRKLTLDF